MILNRKFLGHCLHPRPTNDNSDKIGDGSLVGISKPCSYSWSFTKDQQLSYGGTLFVLHSSEVDGKNRVLLRPNKQTTKDSKWFFMPHDAIGEEKASIKKEV